MFVITQVLLMNAMLIVATIITCEVLKERTKGDNTQAHTYKNKFSWKWAQRIEWGSIFASAIGWFFYAFFYVATHPEKFS